MQEAIFGNILTLICALIQGALDHFLIKISSPAFPHSILILKLNSLKKIIYTFCLFHFFSTSWGCKRDGKYRMSVTELISSFGHKKIISIIFYVIVSKPVHFHKPRSAPICAVCNSTDGQSCIKK